MEKTSLGFVLPLKSDWIDIGSWKSFWEYSEKDKNGNVFNGDSLAFKSSNNLLISQNRLIVGLGINNLIIVETSDAILVAEKNKSEEVKNIVNYLISHGRNEGEEHRKIYRPWGNYLSVQEGNNWKVKIIEVNPGESLSLQLHSYRTEHWIVVDGIATIEIDKKKLILKKNESCFVPCGAKHRLSNSELKTLTIIEVQSGSYLGEDDIMRFEDNYGRKNL